MQLRLGAQQQEPTESKSEDEQDNEAKLKEQESALVKLAELYRDQKSVLDHPTPQVWHPDVFRQEREWFGRGHYHVEIFHVFDRKSQNG
jgi:hypothetical protein